MHRGLGAYNAAKYGKKFHPKIKSFGYYMYENRVLVGGIYGTIDEGNWVYIDLLFVDEAHRGKDIATKLWARAEEWCKAHGCTGIRTTTWEFQALGFYEKMGLTVYGVLEDHPIGAKDYYVKKKF